MNVGGSKRNPNVNCEVVCIIKYLSPFFPFALSISTFMHVYNGNQKLKDEIILTETIPKPFSSSTICHAWRMEKKAHHKYFMEKQRHTHTHTRPHTQIEANIGSIQTIQTRLKKINTHTHSHNNNNKKIKWTEKKHVKKAAEYSAGVLFGWHLNS